MNCISTYIGYSFCINEQTLWEYDTENHTEKSSHTETPLHWKSLEKNQTANHTEIPLLLLLENATSLYIYVSCHSSR